MSTQRQKTNRKSGRPRRRVIPLWRRRWAVAAMAGLALAVVGAGGWWTWQSDLLGRMVDAGRARIVAASADLGLKVKEVLVVGRHNTTRDDLLHALAVTRGDAILGLDLDSAKRRIEALPWVREASVDRLLPDTVVINLHERRPLALWQEGGRFSVIDRKGEVIRTRHLDRFANLLVVVGDDAPAHTAALLGMLDTEPKLRAAVKAAVRVGGRRWNLQMANGIDVRLPEDDAARAWRRLAKYQRVHHVLDRDVRVLDLRLPDRLIVRRGADVDVNARGQGQET